MTPLPPALFSALLPVLFSALLPVLFPLLLWRRQRRQTTIRHMVLSKPNPNPAESHTASLRDTEIVGQPSEPSEVPADRAVV